MQDILISEDLDIKSGDFAVGDSENQHVLHILKAMKGEYKQTPEIGVGIEQMLATDEPLDFLIEAKKNLEYDGMKVKNITLTEDQQINVDAKYST